MQTKTISKAIKSKLEEWLKTINDQQLKTDLEKNILVSGGSITSMFLNEPVNDYDIYIKDRNVLMNLVNYYTKDYTDIKVLDGTKKEELVRKLEKDYENTVDNILMISNAYAISLRNLKEDQIKLFFLGEKGFMRIEKTESQEIKKYNPVFFSPNAISLSDDIQIVIRFFGDDKQIHKTFDFIHATNYFTFESGLVTNKEALESILTKQLKYQGSLYPLTSIIRMRKFLKRNWNINAGEILKIIFQLSELNLKDTDVLEEQLIGVDIAYFEKLVAILRNVDTKNITSDYLNTIIDKVFGDSDFDQ